MPTCYSLVRHSAYFSDSICNSYKQGPRNILVRLACVMHTASVNPEPESNSFRKKDVIYRNNKSSLLRSKKRLQGYFVVHDYMFLFCALDVKEHSIKMCTLFQSADNLTEEFIFVKRRGKNSKL